MKIAEKPNISDIESLTIEHPKSVTKLSKPIKQSKLLFNNQTK